MSKEKITVEKEKVTENTVEFKEGKIGTMLHDVRVKKKLSIDDVAQNLRIKPAYLTAIEESDYEHIPTDPYGTGFIRSYASFLGLNSTRIVQIFKEELKPATEEEPTVVAPVSTETNDNKELTNFELYIPNQKAILIGLGILVLTYLLWNVFSSTSSDDQDVIDETPVASENNDDFLVQVEDYTMETEENVSNEMNDAQVKVTEESFEEAADSNKEKEAVSKEKTEKAEGKPAEKKVEKPVEQKTEKTTVTSSAPKKTGRVVLKIKKETWVEVKDDDKLWISKVLHAGDEYVLPEDGVGKVVSFGNTDGVDVVIDGKVVTIVSNNKKTNISMDAFLGNH